MTFKEEINTFSLQTYCFDLIPSAYLESQPFMTLQTSSQKFLTANAFEFDECFKHGVPFMSLKKYHEYESLLALYPNHMTAIAKAFYFLNAMGVYYSIVDKINSWFNKPADTMLRLLINCSDEFTITSLFLHIGEVYGGKIHPEIDGHELVLNICKADCRTGEKFQHQLFDLLTDAFGFGQVIETITALKKVVVGHNMLLDLMFMFLRLFEKDTLSEFKALLKLDFVRLYDTKSMFKEAKETIDLLSHINRSALSDLYLSLNE